MFCTTFSIWHGLGQADRWHNGVEAKGTRSIELQNAISMTWVQIFGPFNFRIIDGEKGISSKETGIFLKSCGCRPIERAKGQYGRMIERRGASLVVACTALNLSSSKNAFRGRFKYCWQVESL